MKRKSIFIIVIVVVAVLLSIPLATRDLDFVGFLRQLHGE